MESGEILIENDQLEIILKNKFDILLIFSLYLGLGFLDFRLYVKFRLDLNQKKRMEGFSKRRYELIPPISSLAPLHQAFWLQMPNWIYSAKISSIGTEFEAWTKWPNRYSNIHRMRQLKLDCSSWTQDWTKLKNGKFIETNLRKKDEPDEALILNHVDQHILIFSNLKFLEKEDHLV